jgi:hypothetical protein
MSRGLEITKSNHSHRYYVASNGNSLISIFLSFVFFMLGNIMFLYALGFLTVGDGLDEDTRGFNMVCAMGFWVVALVLGIIASVEHKKGGQVLVYVPVQTQPMTTGQIQNVAPQVVHTTPKKTCLDCGEPNNMDVQSCLLCSGSRFRTQ